MIWQTGSALEFSRAKEEFGMHAFPIFGGLDIEMAGTW
jgi:hypothetical protein